MLVFVIIFSTMVAQHKNEKEQVKQADIDFSNLSVNAGFHKAFLTYVADDGVLLRPNSYPLEGKKAIAEFYKKSSDSSYILTWKPLYADVSSSGELGYTYGTWELKLKSGNEPPSYGTYATVWKKNKKGEWKFVLDTGNDGLGKGNP